MSNDRIEKQILIRAPRTKVWNALTNAKSFGEWFGVALEGSFVPGKEISGKLLKKQYEHVPFRFTVDRIEPETLFSWYWHPYAIDNKVDYSSEPQTLVVFELKEVEGGTLLTLVESGFESIPLWRRSDAFQSNTGGWEHQMKAIHDYVGEYAGKNS